MGAPARRGMTLIEVLLALAILGLGLAVLIESTARCLGVARKAKNFEAARYLLHRVELEHPLSTDQPLTEGVEEGAFDAPYDRFAWRRMLIAAGLDDEPLFEVRTQISWAEDRREASEETVTMVYKPEQASASALSIRK
ncbi:MAG: prepilin-type N-terminal cleavage/methylation domain-containing protein [Kiritimatiellaeota bacterium]|nr:prepilin-type N-terminal cleavage/methylation domain-containing protein [Kiritimatiellota bacterium]